MAMQRLPPDCYLTMICIKCGKDKDHYAKGMCKVCYNKQWPRKKPKKATCANCRRCMFIAAKGLCKTCYHFELKHGHPRPIRTSKGKPFIPCSNCKEKRAYCRGRCSTCYCYWHQHKKERPKHLWRKHCAVCSRPKVKGVIFTKGRCRSCYEYWYKHNRRDKPKERIALLYPLGWCECGHVAVKKIVSIGETFAVCIKCADWEKERQ
jgi:hypothetical protein